MTENNAGGDGGDFLASLPEGMRNEGALKGFSGPEGGSKLATSFMEARRTLSSRSMADMEAPTDDAGVRAVLTKMGRNAPDSPDGYTLADKPNTAAFRALAHKHGLSVKQAEAMFSDIDTGNTQSAADRKTRAETDRANDEKTLRGEWGVEYDANLELAKNGAKHAFSEEMLKILETTGLENHPEMRKLLHSRGLQMKEGVFHAAGAAGAGSATTVETAEAELNKFATENQKLIMSQDDTAPGVLAAKARRNVLNSNLAKLKVTARNDAAIAAGTGV